MKVKEVEEEHVDAVILSLSITLPCEDLCRVDIVSDIF